MPDVVLKVNGLKSGYDDKPVLQGIDFEVRQGEITVIAGRNGVGKSTLMKTLIGLIPTTAGSIVFGGEAIQKLPAHKRARLGIGYVPQGRDVFPRLTVSENLAIGAMATQNPDKHYQERVFSYFPILAERLNQKAGVLSGGQQQQLAIARALVARPQLLLMDEPSEGIQPNVAQDIARIMVRLKQDTDLSIILVEQNIDMICSVAQRVYVMEKGLIVAKLELEGHLDPDALRRHLAI